ncbi:MAG: hypothetical protein EPN93_16635 [Spirochaetes bacterium]|nr:MAG: hypothetical protein EPN93_16635 [Spirochaetota bacterium]
MSKKSYGSGHFGEWIEDEFGLPAYRYDCNQVTDTKAVSPVNPVLRPPTEHLHEVGNDRLVGVASNFGHVQVRQDEGAPKFLNDFDPSTHQFGGGIGYLADRDEVISTFYDGGDRDFNRVFGVGYFRKTVSTDRYTIDQTIFAPFGDDPLLISKVSITNNREVPTDLRWIEYWGCRMFQFSFRFTIYAGMEQDIGKSAGLRREFAKRFRQNASKFGDCGLVTETKFAGWEPSQEARWNTLQGLLGTVAKNVFGGAIKTPREDITFEDLDPPRIFLLSLDAPADGMSVDAEAFFGKGGAAAPDGASAPLPGDPAPAAGEQCMLLERRFSLAAGETRTLSFAFGYLPDGYDVESLAEKYRIEPGRVLAASGEEWKRNRIKFVTRDDSWVDRELLWHHYYLRGNLTFDSFFREHILAQGHVYQYILGFSGPNRDSLQHALPFLLSEPRIVRETIRFVLKQVLPDGELPYSTTGHGMFMPSRFYPSDQEMWLLWLASEYVLATKDLAFLDETISTYPDADGNSGTAPVRALLGRCYSHLVEITGTGTHGLQRLSNGDWNDGIVLDNVTDEEQARVRAMGESVLNAAMASHVLERYSCLLALAHQGSAARDARAMAQAQREAVRAQWGGRWFKRAWLTPEMGWVGEDEMWLEPQPWTVIGGAASPDQRKILLENIDDLLRRPSPIGAMLTSRTPRHYMSAPGVGTGGGIWPSINGTLVWALSLMDPSLAWDEWKKNSLARHAEVYPEIWYGIWSAPDTLNSVTASFPGHAPFNEALVTGIDPGYKDSYKVKGMNWTDFPVMNMHPHAWPLYSLVKLMGIEFTVDGVCITPTCPKAMYRFESPLVGLVKTDQGYSGWYAPKTAGTWQILLRLKDEAGTRSTKLEVNGEEQTIGTDSGDGIKFSGSGSADAPLRWSITRERQPGI